jgi:co-chaperonin GroES (HSP10)
MGKQAIDIDRLAREAKRDAKAAKAPSVRLTEEGLRGYAACWQIIVIPREPKRESAGGIALPESRQRAEEIFTTIGEVIACGPSALDGKTPSGIEIRKITAGIQSPDDLIGKWVVYQRYAGAPIRNKRLDAKLVVLTVSELLMVVEDPDEWDCEP